jgi:hypothetical protein
MARIRTIKPEFFTSLTIASLSSSAARLAFIGLWTYVDDEGRGVADPHLIKAAIFPLDHAVGADEVAAIMRELRDRNLIVTYNVDGKPLLAITNWSEHQRISHPTPSKLPAPPVRKPPRGSRKPPEVLRSPPETLRPEQGTGKGTGKGREQGISLSSPSVLQDPPLDPDERERLGVLIKGLFDGNGADDPHAATRAARKKAAQEALDDGPWVDGAGPQDGTSW